MLDFLRLGYEFINRESRITVQYVTSTRVKDLMVRGGCFYAAWDFENEEWTQNICRVYELIDASIQEFVKSQIESLNMNEYEYKQRYKIPVATMSGSKIPENFLKYIKQVQDNFKPLNTRVVFKSDKAARELYSSKRLPYDPIEMDTPAYDRLMSVLYSDSERQKIEWLVGAGLCRDNGKIQKFGVLYGEPGTGKGTVLDIITMLFEGYTSAFEADALGHKSDSFALEPFKTNPVVAIQTDGNLSRIESNARLNTLISHETMTVNEKFKNKYTAKFDTILLMGTNDPVRITNAKSGLLRRLIDIEPTGNTIPKDEYDEIKEKLPFEISGIAYRCMELYSNNKKLYNAYRPMTMMSKTNEFYDFVLEYYDQFCAEDYILLSTAWTWYKKYVEDSNAYTKLSRRAFASELCAYFEEGQHDEWYVDDDGSRKHLSSVYRGFRRERFKNVRNRGIGEVKVVKSKKNSVDGGGEGSSEAVEDSKADILKNLPKWLKLKDVSGMSDDDLMENPLNVYLKDAKAQYAVPTDTGGSKPKNSWDYTRSKLNAINTLREHYILTQSIDPKLICIDFDLKDPETGEKSLEKNLLAAMKFPKTYAETSKSGKGLHLYYIYDGNVDDLSMLYDTEIEIKVFTGKSALRRMLYLCNAEEISHINSGLPLKEVKKMLDKKVIEDEKHLRALVKKGLAKKVFPNTKPSIDYIYMVIEEAYESGISYNVTDLKPAILNMAYSSTNNADYCVEKVLSMEFQSEDIKSAESRELHESRLNDSGYFDKPIAFYDCEVFPNLFIICYKIEGGKLGEKDECVKLINPTPNEVSKFVDSYRLIGFNNLDYDNHIVYARILGYSNYEIYNLSRSIIKKKGAEKHRGFYESKNLSYTDIYDFSNTKQSLKKWEIELGIHHQEFPLGWDEDVPENMWDSAADYCCNDVTATEILFYHLKADWSARQILASISGLSVNDKTNAHTCRIIFGKNRNPQKEFNCPDLSKEFPGYEFCPTGIDESRYNIDVNTINSKKPKSVMTSGKSIFMGDDPSEGGYVYYEIGMYRNVALLDIASLHPTTIETIQLFGPVYTAKYSEIKKARIAIKHRDWEKARVYLDGAISPFLEGIENKTIEEQQKLSDDLSYAFKICLNSCYGMTSAKYDNPCKDPRNIDNVVAKRGALFMILLKHEVQKRGYRVAHVKTDSIKIPEADEKIISFVMDFGKKYGYSFEHEATYDRMCLVNKSVYIAKYDQYGERTKNGKHANQWTHTGTEFQDPYLFKTLFSHEPIEHKDYCQTKSVDDAKMYLDKNEDLIKDMVEELYSLESEKETATSGKAEINKKIKALKEEIDSVHSLSFVGKCGSFVPVEPGVGGGYLVRVDDEGKVSSINGCKGYRWLETEEVDKKDLWDKIDMSYFREVVDKAYVHLSKFGDADEFING